MYWYDPSNDGAGKYTYSGPTTFNGYFVKETFKTFDRAGNEILANGYIITDSDEVSDPQGGEFVMKGEDSSGVGNPENLADAREIKNIKIVDTLDGDLSIYRVEIV